MKTSITTFAIAALAFLCAAPQAQARHPQQSRVYINGNSSCSPRVYTERYLIGHDRCGNPVWGTRTVRRQHVQAVYPRYVAPCPQPYYPQRPRYSNNCHRPYYGNGISVQTTFRRY